MGVACPQKVRVRGTPWLNNLANFKVMSNVILLILILLVMVVPMLSMQRKQKQHLDKIHAMQGSLVVGDKVVTTAGMHGEVVAIGDTTVVLLVAPSVEITYEKSAILKKLSETDDRDGTDVDESHPDSEH